MRRLLELLYSVYAAVVFAVVVFGIASPLIIVGPTLPIRRWIGRTGVRLALSACLIRFRVRGLRHLPHGPCVVVANHASYLDGLVMTAALPGRFTFVVQHGAEHWPYIGLVIRRMGVSFVNRSEKRAGAHQTRRLIRRLNGGESLAVFPEGTFKDDPGLLPFHTGAFLMAARAGLPVVPAAIRGTRRMFGEGRRLLRHARIEVRLFEPLAPAGADRDAAVRLRDAARVVVAAHCGEPDTLRHESAPTSR